MIRVEFYEGARQLTGTASVEIEARTFGEALVAVARLYPDLEGRVVDGNRLTRHWRASINAMRSARRAGRWNSIELSARLEITSDRGLEIETVTPAS